VRTEATLTEKMASTARLISILLASGLTSKWYWLRSSRSASGP